MYEEDEAGCWIFLGKRDKKGYGTAGMHGSAHRLFYVCLVGPVPDGLQIDHLCRVKHCVNPEHMEPVTVQENLRRKYEAMPRRTHCQRGHAYTESNTYITYRGHQECIECRKRNKRNFRIREKAAGRSGR